MKHDELFQAIASLCHLCTNDTIVRCARVGCGSNVVLERGHLQIKVVKVRKSYQVIENKGLHQNSVLLETPHPPTAVEYAIRELNKRFNKARKSAMCSPTWDDRTATDKEESHE